MSPGWFWGSRERYPNMGSMVGAVTPEGRGGRIRLASHGYPSDCLCSLGNDSVILRPVPSAWHYCITALLPWAAASAGLGTDPATHSRASAPKPDLQWDFPTLIMKASKQLKEKHFKLYWLYGLLTRKVFGVPLCGPLQPALCSAPRPQHPRGPWCRGQKAG